jgi:DNA-binding HxlR family transcriptional regulator
MNGYGTYCPVAKALEILGERWTLLLVRDLLLGARHFNDFRRSIPLITPAMLSKRLRTLEQVGIVQREAADYPGRREYRLTEAGRELKPFVDVAGTWGQRWARSKLPHGELHPSTLMWDIHRFLKTELFPARRTVLNFEFTDLKVMKYWWLVAQPGEVDVCLDDPGYEVDVWIACPLLTLTQVFMGDLSIAKARAAGKLKLDGDTQLIRDMPRWFGLMPFSHIIPGIAKRAEPSPSSGPRHPPNPSNKTSHRSAQ